VEKVDLGGHDAPRCRHSVLVFVVTERRSDDCDEVAFRDAVADEAGDIAANRGVVAPIEHRAHVRVAQVAD